MASYPPPPPPPPPGPPYGNDWRYQRRVVREQARMQRDAYRAQRDAYRYQTRGLRRSSIVGPLVLIAVGVVFLLIQTGHIAGSEFWAWYGHWWPMLLLGAGVIMLGEWAFDQYFLSDPNRPRYRRRLGGGVFFLLLALAFAGFVFNGFHNGERAFGFFHRNFGISQDNLDQFLGDKHESDQTLAQTLPAGSQLVVNNPRGDVTVSGTSDDNQIHIAIHKAVYTRTDSEANTKAEQLSPAVTTSGDTLSVTVPALEGARADLTITVPIASPTTVMANHGDVSVSSIRGGVTVTANHGDIDLSAITGTVSGHINNSDASFTARSVTGPVTIEGRAGELTLSDISGPMSFNGDVYGSIHMEHIRGPIRFHTSRTDFQLARLDGSSEISSDDMTTSQAMGPVTLNTRNRNITLDRIAGDVAVTNSNGSVDLTNAPPLGNVAIQNRNGSIDVTVPEHASFTVEAQTTNGDLDNDFALESQGTDTHKSFRGTVGKGGPVLRLTTTQGDLSLKKAVIAPLPPLPPPPPPLSIRSGDGASVIIGKDGIVTSSGDGSRVVVGRDGTRVSTTEDGTSVYVAKDGTTFTSTPDGTRVLAAKDGTRITVTGDGTKVGIGPNRKPLTDAQIDERLKQAEQTMQKVLEQSDREAGSHKARTGAAK